jgi:hypothetical protein
MLILVVIVFLSLSLANPILFNISNTSLLERAVPANQGCANAGQWSGRFCVGNIGPGAYRDECLVGGGEGGVYYIYYQCLAPGECFEYMDADGDRQTDCITIPPRTPDNEDIVTTKLQYGKRSFSTDSSPERVESVQVQEDFGASTSVSAHIMG